MKTISKFAAQLTDKDRVLDAVKALLKETDPQFPEEEARYTEAAAKLKAIRCDAENYLTAKEECFAAAVIYMAWQGFQLNRYLHDHPVPFPQSLDRLYREQTLPLLPAYRHRQRTLDEFRPSQADEDAAFLGVLDYYTYLETVGYKLAHYYGYRLADHLLCHAVAGYTSDPVSTEAYRRTLEDYLQIDLRQLD